MEWLLVSAVNVERQPEAVVIIVRLRRSVVFSNIFDELYSRLNSYLLVPAGRPILAHPLQYPVLNPVLQPTWEQSEF